MKILYIHQYFSTPSGATGTRSYEFARRLCEAGHDVTMLCGSSQLSKTTLRTNFHKGMRSGEVDGINVIELELAYSNHDGFIKRAFKFLTFSLKTIKYTQKIDYDILFATSTPLTVAIPGIVMKMFRLKKRKIFILEVRDLWPELPKAMGVINNKLVLRLLGRLEKMAYKSADYGVALSPGIAKGMKRFGSLNDSTVTLIPNGCDNKLFNTSTGPTSNEELNAALTRYKTAIFTGAHGLANGLEAILHAAQEVQVLGRDDIKFIFVGDGKMKPKIIQEAQRLNLNNCLFFEPLPKTEISYVMQQATLGLMTLKNIEAFYYGTSPNKFFDYIAAGLPVVNNYPGWLADLIQDYECGITCPPDDASAFAHAIIELIDDNNHQHRASQALILAREFDRDKLASNFVELCEKVNA
tara:strand:- start:200344 stop:201576 length:1233 start_codon:yes stop_codon:yes gene_type:complete